MKVIQKTLGPGITLTAIQTEKFKSAILGASILVPIERETAAVNALVPAVLCRGTAQYPDMTALTAAKDELYGGSIEPVVRKKGETQSVGLLASFMDDAYTLDGAPLLEDAVALFGQVLLKPHTKNGVFDPDYVAGEKQNLISHLRAQVNDKRQYAVSRLVKQMCADEGYGVDRQGDEASAAAITPETLWQQYQTLLTQGEIRFYYCGSASLARVEGVFAALADQLPQSKVRTPLACQVKAKPDMAQVRTFKDAMDVTQGKLTMGFRTGGVAIWDDAYPALLVAVAIFGGSTNSKLFMNVREKLSLCYYASAALERLKGIVIVSSGVEFAKFKEAETEILAQLHACKEKDFTDEELEGARRSLINDLRSALDSQGGLEDYWLTAAVAGVNRTPQALVDELEAVTADQVAKAACAITLDSIYYLTGREE